MNIKSILIFVSGLVIGGATGVFGTRKYFKDKYEKLYEEDHELLEDYYKRVNGKYIEGDQKDTCSNCDYFNAETNICGRSGNKIKNPETTDCLHWRSIDGETNSPNETDSVPGGRMTPEERKAVKERLNKNLEGTNYAAMYRGNRSKQNPVDDAAESECCERCEYYESGRCEMKDEIIDPDDFCNDFTLSLSIHTPDEEAFDEHQKNKNKPPKIISAEAYEDLPAHIEQNTLYFWAFDEMLTDENEEPVEEPERLIGDALTKYGFADGPERLIFVMNYAQDVCYEVQKLDASWTDTH